MNYRNAEFRELGDAELILNKKNLMDNFLKNICGPLTFQNFIN